MKQTETEDVDLDQNSFPAGWEGLLAERKIFVTTEGVVWIQAITKAMGRSSEYLLRQMVVLVEEENGMKMRLRMGQISPNLMYGR